MSPENQQTQRVATGIVGLDEILDGGLPPDHLYLVEGASGTGKTTLALKFILEGARCGEPVLYVTLSETAKELRQVAASHDWSLDGVALHELPAPQESPTEDKRYTLFHPVEVEMGELLQEIFTQVERVQPTRLVLDTLAGLRLVAEDPLHHRQQVQRLRRFLTRHACTTLLVDELHPANPDYHPSSLVHGIIRLERRLPTYGAAQRRLAIGKMRGLNFLDTYHDFKIIQGDFIVYPHLVAAKYTTLFQPTPVSSGVAELDSLLGGGLERGQSALLLGPAGTGKSTLAMQYATAAAKRGERSAIYLFDESISTFFARGAALGMALQAQVEAGLLMVTKIDPIAMPPGEFVHEVHQAVQHKGAQLVVIDSLSGYLHAMPEQQFLLLHLQELLAYLGSQGVVSLLGLVQTGLFGGSLRSSIDLSYLADTIILLRFFEAVGQVRKALSVIKKRGGSHESTIHELWFESAGIRLGAPLEHFQGIITRAPQYFGEENKFFER